MKQINVDKKGQTSVEYLMLLAVAFITAYLMVTGPIANFTGGMLETIHNNLHNVVRSGELSDGEIISPETAGHPSDPARLKPLHM